MLTFHFKKRVLHPFVPPPSSLILIYLELVALQNKADLRNHDNWPTNLTLTHQPAVCLCRCSHVAPRHNVYKKMRKELTPSHKPSLKKRHQCHKSISQPQLICKRKVEKSVLRSIKNSYLMMLAVLLCSLSLSPSYSILMDIPPGQEL